MSRIILPEGYEPEPEEEIWPITVHSAHISCAKGTIGQMQCVLDDQFRVMQACSKKRALTLWPTYRLNVVPEVMMISRKDPFPRGQDYVRESQHPGVYCEFYTNRRGRFMRLNDAYRHVVFQLNRAKFTQVPFGFPEANPDLDIGWRF